jgi:hypothetical protein
VKQQNGVWEAMRSRAVGASIGQNWSGGPKHITAKDIDAFMGGADVPVVKGCMRVPTATAPVVEFEGSLYGNTWRNTIMRPDSDALNDLVLRPGLLRMLRESLCAKPDAKSIEEMISIANGDDQDEIEFRFLMTWLAAPIQSPGLNLQTNLWLLGELGGTLTNPLIFPYHV